MRIDAFNEFPENFFDSGALELSREKGLYELPGNDDRFPMTFSLRLGVTARRRTRAHSCGKLIGQK